MTPSNVLDKALSQFSNSNGILIYDSPFFSFISGLRRVAINEDGTLKYLLPARDSFSSIFNKFWNITIIVDRLAWTKNLALRGLIEELRSSAYFRIDITHFHTEIRSILDYIANIIGVFFKQTGQIPSSFNKLKQRIKKYEKKLNAEIYELIESISWFDEIRTIRDSLIHNHGKTFTPLKATPYIGFQVNDETGRNLVNKNFLEIGNNIVSVEKYVAYYMALLINFLNDIGSTLLNLRIDGFMPQRMYIQGAGLPVLKEWIDDLNSELKQSHLTNHTTPI